MEDRMKNGLLLALWAFASLAFGADTPEDLQQRIDAARAKLDEAARELADLHRQDTESLENTFQVALPALPDIESRVSLGVLLDPSSKKGIAIAGVTPGGPGEEAGIEAGDVIVTLNGTNVRDGAGKPPLMRLLDVLKEVNPGDTVRVEYLRHAELMTADVTAAEPAPRMPASRMNIAFSTMAFASTEGAGAPFAGRAMIGGLELFDLNEDLGRYFGTPSGVLVLSVPQGKDGAKDGLLPGDVVRSIDGRAIASTADFMNAVGRRNAEMTVEVLRDGGQIAVQMPRQAMPAGMFGSSMDGAPMGGETRAISIIRDAPPTGVSSGSIVVGGSAKRAEGH
jgi:predicted metalloprotease with PDZ domain